MKISVDAGCLGVKDERLKVGVYSVVKNLLIELSKLDKTNEYFLYTFYPIEKSLLKKIGRNMKNIVIPSRGWLKIVLPARLLLDKPDIFIAANQAMPQKFPFSQYKTLGIFYDIAFEKFPELYAYAASVAKHKITSKELAQKADKIITISENTKKDIEHYYKVPNGKITVAHLGVQHFPNIATFKNRYPYFLFVGAFKKSKNIPILLRSFANFLKNSKVVYDLLLVGGDKWLDPEINKALKDIPKEISSHIKILGFVDDKKLISLYKGAIAFVSPSVYEGFGLPFVEAQALGCPVVAANRGSVPEILGKSALFVNPENVDSIKNAMEKMTNKSVRQLYAKKGRENSKKYSWKNFAKKVQSALQSL